MDHISSESIGRFLTVADASEILNISIDEVHELITSAELPAIRVGSPARWRVERRVLEDYIQQKYEETRRMSLWHEANAASIQDIDETAKHRR
ncbi:helix-turn-helix domain-containing protein [Paramicrobacterium agarici]|uniref:AlpA family transcriptional regulator n=1 Tax=Paramicrobacterium agarici TaxID=630514 RepID=A0A2A9DY02_9MICO|nr:helix-turn-helix domain-containing protein [Microbacterium agarici]PFG30862.1 AlpA family transcriptional regulator [Microbacterium agarici]TQO23929.1 excisionase family DNA binding protein [Microbacterium agarici]